MSSSPTETKLRYSFEIDIPNLIKAVEIRRGLYDPSSPAYRDRPLKKKLWDEVCVEVCTPAEWAGLSKKAKSEFGLEVQKKWSSLRNCYRRELVLQNQIKAGQIRKKMKRTYYHFRALDFLRPFTDNRIQNKKINTVDQSIGETDNLEDPLDDESDDDDGVPSPSSSQNYEMTMEIENIKAEEPFYNKPNCSMNMDEHGYKTIEVEFNGIKSEDNGRNNPRKDDSGSDDGDEAFLQSLLPTLREFTSDQKLLLRIEIMKTILNFKTSQN